MPVTPLDSTDPPRLGDYELVGRLGAGGMGVVYLGRGPGGQMAAVKLVRIDLAHDATFRERFRREVEALRRVSGPRVARLLAADTEATQPYLVVEYVDGPTLADAVAAAGPLPGPRLRALAAALAEAIVIIHEAGVIHRDLKPSNVILAADQPKLVDFGIASATGAIPLTMAGTVIGSAGWMAPEQAAGAVSTPAVDVFSWASLVAYAGTGRPPFGIGSPEAVTARILNGTPDLDGLPQDVRPFVEAAFIRDPLLRPSAKAVLSGIVGRRDEASTDELVEETTNLIEHTWLLPAAGGAGAATPVAPPPAAPPKRRWPIVAAVVGALALLAGIGVALAMSSGGGDDDDTAEAPIVAPPTTAAPTTTTTEEPTTTTEETTTTTAAPVGPDVTLPVSFIVDVSGLRAPGSDCSDTDGLVSPDATVSVEDDDTQELVAPEPMGDGVIDLDFGGQNFICAYDFEFDVPDLDSWFVVLDDTCAFEVGREEIDDGGIFGSEPIVLDNDC